MNPIVKNFALKLCETAPACVLEVLFETVIKTWNEHIREFNLPFSRIDLADLKGVTMNQASDINIDNMSTYLNPGSEAPKNINNGGISIEREGEQMFYNYFREHMKNYKNGSPFNYDLNEIRPEAHSCQPQNFETAVCLEPENIPRPHKKTRDMLSGKAAAEVCLIDFSEGQNLKSDVRRVSKKPKKLAATNENSNHRESTHDISSLDEVNLLESRRVEATKPEVTALTGDIKQSGSEYASLQETNHGINLLNQIYLLESRSEELANLTAAEIDESSTQSVGRTLEAYNKIKDIAILSREMNITDHKDLTQWNSPLATKANGLLKQDVVSTDSIPHQEVKHRGDSTPHQEVKHLMKGQRQFGQDEKQNLAARPSANENSLEHETQNMGINATHKKADREGHISKKDKFSNSKDMENRFFELNFITNSMNDGSKSIVGSIESFEFLVEDIDFAGKSTLLQEFNKEDIERKWLEPNWLEIPTSENNLSPLQESHASPASDFENETIEKLDGPKVLQNVVTECNTSAYSCEVTYTKNEPLGSEKKQKKDVMEENEPVDWTTKESNLQKLWNSPSSVVQTKERQPLEIGNNQVQVFTAEFQSHFEGLPNTERESKRIIYGCEQKENEINTEKIEVIEGDNRKSILHENGLEQSEISNTSTDYEFDDVSKDGAKGDLKEKKKLFNSRFYFRPIRENLPTLGTENGNDNLFQQEQNLKRRMEQHRQTIKQSNNTNNLITSVQEKIQKAKMREIRHSFVRYPLQRITVKAKYKNDTKELFKAQNNQQRLQQLVDDNKCSMPNKFGQHSDVNVNLKRENSKSDLMGSKLIQMTPHTRKIISRGLHKRSSKSSVTLVSDIKEEMQKGPSQNASVSGFQNGENFQNPRTLIIGSCSNCVELRSSENEGKCPAGRNAFIKKSSSNMHPKLRRLRSKSRSIDRTISNSNLSKMRGKSPNKRVSFIENNRIFSYDPEQSVLENFSRSITINNIEGEKSNARKELSTEVGTSDGRGETFEEPSRVTGGCVNLGFVDVPMFDCLPDSGNNAPNANIASFGEDEQLLSSIVTAVVSQDQKIPQKLSVARWKAEGRIRRWLKYGLMAQKGISVKKVLSMMSKK